MTSLALKKFTIFGTYSKQPQVIKEKIIFYFTYKCCLPLYIMELFSIHVCVTEACVPEIDLKFIEIHVQYDLF